MTDDRHNNGRRSTDSWVAKAAAIALIAGVVYSVAAWGVPLVGIPKRVDAIEAIQPALLYMACVNFGEKHTANEIPAACSQATRR